MLFVAPELFPALTSENIHRSNTNNCGQTLKANAFQSIKKLEVVSSFSGLSPFKIPKYCMKLDLTYLNSKLHST